ncbi:MAG: glycosyltransferase family 4 protein [Deltaproteobacteria bacterium]|nr:glycosyltransferase family 4 protein [Deltaproteobacteria bacterium]MBW2399559.1 glycosyltransferase family 4 protein [Deltaproteobacteria bacterium]MBW2667772.1 glycosyltransferase family 4 protein [Deltaproteobacteria bacterium]
MTVVESASPLRIAILGAFPFPLDLGSQIYVRDQVRALTRAGASTTLLCYGTGNGASTDDIAINRVPHALSARKLRSGPSLGKPIADAALIGTFIAAHRRHRFDIALAHNVEAGLAALAARPLTGVPVVYVAHTLLGEELPHWGPAALDRTLAATGRAFGRLLARRCDGVLALCEAAAARFRNSARGPVAMIPPGLDPTPAPDADQRSHACKRFGLSPGRFAIYSGNLDRYQDLDLLGEAAARIPEFDVVVATHGEDSSVHPALRTVRVADHAEMRSLIAAAGVAVLPRRTPGGFPIKLLGYMEAAAPIVAIEGVAEGLIHDESAWLLPRAVCSEALADGIRRLLMDPERARRVGEAARRQLEAVHGWHSITERTLTLLECVRDRSAAAV